MTRTLSLLLAATLALSACGEAKKTVVKAGVNQLTVENVSRAQPQLAPVFEADPELAQRYINELKRAVNETGGELTPQVYDQARSVLSTAMSAKVVEVETPLQRRFIALAGTMFGELKASDPSRCADMLLGRPIGNLSTVLSQDYVEAEFATMADILSADTVERPPADAARGLELFTAAFIPALESAGVDMAAEGWQQTMTGEQACDAFIAVAEARAQSPDADLRDTLAADRDAVAG